MKLQKSEVGNVYRMSMRTAIPLCNGSVQKGINGTQHHIMSKVESLGAEYVQIPQLLNVDELHYQKCTLLLNQEEESAYLIHIKTIPKSWNGNVLRDTDGWHHFIA